MGGMRRALGILGALLALSPMAAAQAPVSAPAPADLARRVQAHFNTIADFTADFVGTFRYEYTHQVSVERGSLKVKRPSRMRWTYTKPDRKEFVADGTKLFSYFPEDRMGWERLLADAEASSLALLFLAGKGDITRDFVSSMAPEQPAGEWRLALTPKKKQDDYTSLTLGVQRESLALTGLVIVDDEGTQTFQFTNFKTNRGLKDSDFHFTFPPGTVKR